LHRQLVTRGFDARRQQREVCYLARAVGSRLDRKCGLGVSFDLITGRPAFDRETAAPVLAALLLER
jgi:hypothetical protein